MKKAGYYHNFRDFSEQYSNEDMNMLTSSEFLDENDYLGVTSRSLTIAAKNHITSYGGDFEVDDPVVRFPEETLHKVAKKVQKQKVAFAPNEFSVINQLLELA